MYDCLGCSEPLGSRKPIISRTELTRRTQSFIYFCQLLGLSPDQSFTFSQKYDFNKELPFCVKCFKYATDLAKHGESREILEEDILALQMSICHKLRDVSKATIQIDKIVQQVRKSVKTPPRLLRSNGLEIGNVEISDEKDFRGLTIRNLIIEFMPLEIVPPKVQRRHCNKPKRNRKARKQNPKELVDSFPESFVIPDTFNIAIPKAEIKEEPIDPDLEDAAAWAWATNATAPVDDNNETIFGKGDSSSSADEDDWIDNDESLFILPELEADANFSSVNETNADDSVSSAGPQRKPAQKSKYSTNYNEDSDSEEDGNDSDYREESETQKKGRKFKERNPAPLLSKSKRTKKCMEYLGEIDTSDENKWTFKGVEVIKDSYNYKCGRCGEIINKSQDRINLWASMNIRKHIQEKHFGGYQCTMCPKEAYFKFSSYYAHVERHLNRIPINCEICGKQYTNNGASFQLHLWSHKNDAEKQEAIKTGYKPPTIPIKSTKIYRNDQCPECGKCFMGPKELKKHEIIHKDKAEREKEKLPCPICGKMYAEGYLAGHIKYTHEKPPPLHTCKICGDRFMKPSLLQRHTRQTHTFEKPYVCNICSKSFFQQAALTTHLTVHSEERVSCSACSSTFKGKSSLRRHLKTAHGSSVRSSVKTSTAVQVPQASLPLNDNYEQYNLFNAMHLGMDFTAT